MSRDTTTFGIQVDHFVYMVPSARVAHGSLQGEEFHVFLLDMPASSI